MSLRKSRREFLASSALLGAGFWAAGSYGEEAGKSPNEKLNIGVAGVAGRGGANLGAVAREL